MPHLTGIRKLTAASLFSAVAVISIACSGNSTDPTATSLSATATQTTEATSSPGGNVTPTSDLPISNPAANLSSIDIIKAQEQVMIDLFNDTVDSVVKIRTATRTGAGGEGSGWIWDQEGHIVTNYHVVEGATEIAVFFFDGREYRGDVVGFDQNSDMAVVKIELEEGDTVQPSVLGNSSDLQVGQMAIALGNPFGTDFSMTTGVVSGLGRLLPSGFSTRFSIPSVIQTDAAINPGNSGGPLLNIDGEVIGMNTQIRSESGSNSGVGFAVPVDLAKRVVPNLITEGEHEYSFVGISGIELYNELRDGLELPNTQQGAYITRVEPGTPADEAGLTGDSGAITPTGSLANASFDGDLIVAVDGRPVESMDDLIAYLALNTSPGDDVVLTVIRDGQEENIVLTLTRR